MPSGATCEHCGAPLPQEHVESRLMQADLGLWPAQLLAQESAPEAETVEATPPEALAETPVAFVPKKRHTRRGDDYYYQLYFDYMAAAESAPEAADVAQANVAYSNSNSNSNGNSNGSAATNGASNGNGNGNGHHGEGGNGNGSNSSLDMAIAETVPFTMFGENEAASANIATSESGADKATSPGNYNDFEYELISDPSRLAQVAELLAHETVLGVDTETTGLDPHVSELLLLQVSTADKVYIVDCRRLVPLALKPVLENPNVLKIAQN
ncbi:MAG TPA: hypothetical protein VGE04_01685, partial [Chloroflexia bacterium]